MTPGDIIEAKRLIDMREETMRIQEKIKDVSIYQIVITDGNDVYPLTGGGTGVFTSFVPSREALAHLSAEFRKYYSDRLIALNKALSDMGVDV